MLKSKPISTIYLNPYKQVIDRQSFILAFSVQLDERLIERKLSSQNISKQAFETTLKQFWEALTLPAVIEIKRTEKEEN